MPEHETSTVQPPPAKKQKNEICRFEIFINGPQGPNPEFDIHTTFTHAEQLRGLGVSDIVCNDLSKTAFAYALTADKDVMKWGGTDWISDPHKDRAIVTPKSLLKERAIQIAASWNHFVAVGMSGAVYSWGEGCFGPLGHNNHEDVMSPKKIEALKDTHIVQVDCAYSNTIFLSNRGNVYTCGTCHVNGVNEHGVSEREQLVPRLVKGLEGKQVTQVSLGFEHAAAITNQFDLYTWGLGAPGCLGHGNEDDIQTPKLVAALQGKAKQVSCGNSHTAVITVDGLYTFGNNCAGQLGHGDEHDRSEPTLVMSLGNNIQQVSCGDDSTACVSDGSLFEWGCFIRDDSVDHEKAPQLPPKKVEALKDYKVSHVQLHRDHTIAFVYPDSMAPSDRVPATSAWASMINNEEFSDVSFLVENQQVFALKGIFVKRCPFFSAMFESGLSESTNHQNIPISDVRKETFLHLLEFLYADKVNIEPADAIELYRAADMYQLDLLKGTCLESLEKDLRVDNAALLLEKAATSQCEELKGPCMKFLVENFSYVLKTEGFKQLVCPTLLHEVFVAVGDKYCSGGNS